MLGRLLQNYPIGVLASILGLTIAAALLLPRLRIEMDFSTYLPAESAELSFYDDYRATFGSTDDILIIGVHRPAGIFDTSFLRQIAVLADSCRTLPLVARATALTSLSLPRRTPLGLVPLPLLYLATPPTAADSIRIVNHPLLRNRYVAADGRTTTVLLQLESERSMAQADTLVRRLDRLLSRFDFAETHIASTANIEVRYSWLSKRDLRRFVVLSLLVITLVLWFVYRAWLVVGLSLGIFLLSLIHLGGFLALADLHLDLMAPMIPSILLIVSISNAIHIFAKYSEAASTVPAQIAAINAVAKTNFLTTLTTALGFFTLLLSPMPMLYYFGLYVAIGVLLSYGLSILVVPAVLFLVRAAPYHPQGYLSKANWRQVVARLLRIQQRQRPVIVGSCLVLLLLAGWGILRIDTNRTLASPMPAHHSVTRSFQFFEREMAGARDFDLAVTAPQSGGLYDPDHLRALARLHDYLAARPELGALASPVSYFRFLQDLTGGGVPGDTLPPTAAAIRQLDRQAPAYVRREFRSVIDSTRTRGAFRGRMTDLGRDSIAALLAQIDDWIAANGIDAELAFQHTGTPFILDLVNNIQIKAMFKGLLLAILGISLVMALLFFNLRLVLITLLVNLVPLFIVAGLMGWLHIELRGGTSIVFTIAFVIAVDDTIHFLNNILIKQSRGESRAAAIAATLQTTGLPIFITSLVIFLGFILLAFSDFGNVKYLGILVALTSFFALLSDLLLAPLLLQPDSTQFEPTISKPE